LQMVLQRAGYRILAAGDGNAGIREFDLHKDEISLVITDMMLPDQVGTKVVKALRQRSPLIPIIAISGMMGSGHFDELLAVKPSVECLAKPLLPSSLLSAVRRGLHPGAAGAADPHEANGVLNVLRV
jgi:CheY-like chemotaxis protein